MKKILIILGHPDKDTLCGSFEEAYIKGVKTSKADIKHLELGKLKFDPILWKGYKKIQKPEPDLHKAQEYIRWAQHIVLIYPIWWGFVPALLKGFIDRAILPGFAFKFSGAKKRPERFLQGKTCHLIMTMDTPIGLCRLSLAFLNYFIMKFFILGFTGIKINKVSYFGSIVNSTLKQRKKWLKQIKKMGLKMI